jgi:hypothetical protein
MTFADQNSFIELCLKSCISCKVERVP